MNKIPPESWYNIHGQIDRHSDGHVSVPFALCGAEQPGDRPAAGDDRIGDALRRLQAAMGGRVLDHQPGSLRRHGRRQRLRARCTPERRNATRRRSGPDSRISPASCYQQVFSLGGEWERLADTANQFPEQRYKNNIVFKIGKFSVTDDFDDNTYSHDPRTQFMNWGLQYNPTFDFPANVRGYTYGTMVEVNLADYSARYGIYLVSTVANGAGYDMNIGQAHGQALELERRWTILNDLPGTVRLLGWLNNAHMGNYNEAVQQNPTAPDVIADPSSIAARYGFGLSWDQELIKGELGIFGRLGWCQSYAETWMYTECDRTVSIGMLLKGISWDRPKDEVGLAFMVDGLGPQHIAYLAAGGLGFELGDGKINYAPEMVVETYYNLRVRKGIFVTLDLQAIADPGYNRDRGPVFFAGLRGHYEF